MKIVKLSCLLLLFTGFLMSCGSDDDEKIEDCSNANVTFAVTFSEELENINIASMNYANDQSTENCNALKSAYEDYLDAIEAYEDCARQAGQLAEWNQGLDDAREALDDIVC